MFLQLRDNLLRLLIAARANHPATLLTLNGPRTVAALNSETYKFQLDDAFVPALAISIVNSSAATQYFNVEQPASVISMPIPADGIFTYNLTQMKRISIYSTAGVDIFPFAGQNIGSGSTGLYIQAWGNAEWKAMKGQGA